MRKASLTSVALWVEGKLAHVYQWSGGAVTVWDSARNMLLVIELFQDEAFTPDEKAELLLQMLFPDPDEVDPERFDLMLIEVLWDACGLDLDGSHAVEADGPQAFDWQEDAGRIKASLQMAYSADWDDLSRRLSFGDVCDLLGMLVESEQRTPFADAVAYRVAKPPDRAKYGDEYVDAWLERRDYYRLHREPTTEEQTRADRKLTDLFNSLWEAQCKTAP